MAMHPAQASRFQALWRRAHPGAEAVDPVAMWEALAGRYREPHRRYHTLEHVGACLRWLDRAAARLCAPDAVETALWFHDVVYDLGAGDNEWRSARFYLDHSAGASPLFRRRVCGMILASTHLHSAHGGDRRYLVDIDLVGFGLPWPAFRAQTDLVRAEATHLRDAQFAAGMRTFLSGLLDRPTFYLTDFFRERFEETARANASRLLAEFSAQA